ncbi:MAG: hypothetical protein KME15_22230 [Drouetiella hepatica Uher 2000/2452]|uniref:Uncharacterized protein n=1 Tax=Drouetiella hepatica Uher 2000/2452 TaxID=904376 RepID=A0A951UPE0_9CYAN|nr:hypothetical protein [Drouetiella hepatica Uher 2000/2452]
MQTRILGVLFLGDRTCNQPMVAGVPVDTIRSSSTGTNLVDRTSINSTGKVY